MFRFLFGCEWLSICVFLFLFLVFIGFFCVSGCSRVFVNVFKCICFCFFNCVEYMGSFNGVYCICLC